MINLFRRILTGIDPDIEPLTLDHIPVRAEDKVVDKPSIAMHRHPRDVKLKQAAEKHGKPFKCAGQGLEHERMVHPGVFKAPGEIVTPGEVEYGSWGFPTKAVVFRPFQKRG